MWVKVDDQLPDHEKVTEAGRHLGTYGAGRVLAIWLVGMCYCNRALTDGFVRTAIVRTWILFDRRPLDVVEVMALRMPNGDSGLLEKVDGGYRFHDYEHYQPSASRVKEKRKKDRDRKRVGKVIPVGIHGSVQQDSARNPSLSDPVPVPCTSGKDHRPLTRPRFQQPVENLEVLKAIIWKEVQAGLNAGESDRADLLERVKCMAARAGIDYASSEASEYLHDQFGAAIFRLQETA